MELWTEMNLNPDSIINEIVDESPRKWHTKDFVFEELQIPIRKHELFKDPNEKINTKQHNKIADDFSINSIKNFFPPLSTNNSMSDSFILEFPDISEFDC